MVCRAIKNSFKIIAAVFSVAITLTFFSGPLYAWNIERYENDVIVNESGITTITETLHVDFKNEQRHGIFRDIPLKTTDESGQSFKIHLHMLDVADETGRPWPYVVFSVSGLIRIRVGDPNMTLSGRQTYRITYNIEKGALRFYPDHDELYWNLIGTAWDVDIKESENRIMIPIKANGIRAVAYEGAYGSKYQTKDIQIIGNRIVVRTDRPLRSREGLTVAVAWNKGAVPAPTLAKELIWWLQDKWVYLVPIFILIFMLLLWNQKGKDPRTGHSIAAQYEPPDSMTPAEIGTLRDQKAGIEDISATVIDLAVRGYLKLEELKEKKFGKKDYHLISLKSWNDKSLKQHEKAVLETVFSEVGETKKLSDLAENFYSEIGKIQEKIYKELVQKGLFVGNPKSVRNGYAWSGIFFGIIFFFVPRFVFDEYSVLTGPLLVSALVSSILIIVIGGWMPRRTLKGAGVMDRVAGFSEFLKRADKDRIKQMNDPSLFERCLPFAMALGFTNQWAHAFEGIQSQAPIWYMGYGTSDFSVNHFTKNIGDMSSSLNSTFSSGGSSSSSGGSGGGGFSGGGGGGGGGGAW